MDLTALEKNGKTVIANHQGSGAINGSRTKSRYEKQEGKESRNKEGNIEPGIHKEEKSSLKR
jgi:hypothetical protein